MWCPIWVKKRILEIKVQFFPSLLHKRCLTSKQKKICFQCQLALAAHKRPFYRMQNKSISQVVSLLVISPAPFCFNGSLTADKWCHLHKLACFRTVQLVVVNCAVHTLPDIRANQAKWPTHSTGPKEVY